VEQINLVQGKGGQGTSVVACAVALKAAGAGRAVRLDGHDRAVLAAIVGRHGDGPISPGLILGADTAERFDLVVHDGTSDQGTSLLVTRPCYLALRQALHLGITGAVTGVVVVTEPGRALGVDDVAAVTGLPVIATVPLRAEVARAVDAGVLADCLPDPLATAADQILEAVLTATGREVA
jgi:MinD superfamily P-loop ATPase